MKFIKLQLLIIALLVFGSTSAFAALTYDASIDTSSISGQQGYLYMQYDPYSTTVASTATVSGFATDGVLGAQDTVDVVDGTAVTGTLPGPVVFANTYGINDYEQEITFGNTLSFVLSFLNTAPFVSSGTLGSSDFSLGLFSDALGSDPLLTPTGTVFIASLVDNGTVVTPVPAAFWLLGSGLTGLGVIRRKKQK